MLSSCIMSSNTHGGFEILFTSKLIYDRRSRREKCMSSHSLQVFINNALKGKLICNNM